MAAKPPRAHVLARTVDDILSGPYEIHFEYRPEPDGGVLARVVEWPECFAAGRDRTEALTALERAMREVATYRLAHGLELPDAAAGFSGKVLLRMPKTLHRDAERNATREGVSLNTWLTTAIARELGPTRDPAGAKGGQIAEPKRRYRAG